MKKVCAEANCYYCYFVMYHFILPLYFLLSPDIFIVLILTLELFSGSPA